MIGRYVTRAVDAQARWVEAVRRLQPPLADGALFHPIRPIQNFLNGTWLGHPVHAVVTDVPIGALTVSIVADLIGQPVVADVALLLGVLAMVARRGHRPRRLRRGRRHRPEPGDGPRGRSWSSRSSLYVDLARDPAPATRPIGWSRSSSPSSATSLLAARRARSAATSSTSSGPTSTATPGAAPARSGSRSTSASLPTSPRAARRSSRPGSTTWSSSATGDRILALHAQCAHAGGPLAEGTLVDGRDPVPVARLAVPAADGHVARGPAMYDQPAYEVRRDRGGRMGGAPSRRVT